MSRNTIKERRWRKLSRMYYIINYSLYIMSCLFKWRCHPCLNSSKQCINGKKNVLVNNEPSYGHQLFVLPIAVDNLLFYITYNLFNNMSDEALSNLTKWFYDCIIRGAFFPLYSAPVSSKVKYCVLFSTLQFWKKLDKLQRIRKFWEEE